MQSVGYAENSSGGRGREKLNSLVRISVIKKAGTSDLKNPAEPEQTNKEEDNKNTPSGLLSLCQSYGSDDD